MDEPEPVYVFQFPVPKHSGLGIASFVVALMAAFFEFVLFALAVVVFVCSAAVVVMHRNELPLVGACAQVSRQS